MKKILIPVDFSAAAANAVRYAVDLAASLLEPAELILVHVCDQKPAEADDTETHYLQEKAEDEAMEKLQTYARSYCRQSGIASCQTLVTTGQLAKAISLAAKKSDADMIVMGTKGGFGSSTFFASTNTSELIGIATCPVLAVPEDIAFRPILKIVFAADLSLATIPDLRMTARLAQTLNAQLQVVHIDKFEEREANQQQVEEFWTEVQDEIRFPWLDFASIEANDATEGLENYVEKHNADLLVVCPKKRSLFYLMMHGSTSRQIVMDALVPTLALPHSEEEQMDHEHEANLEVHFS